MQKILPLLLAAALLPIGCSSAIGPSSFSGYERSETTRRSLSRAAPAPSAESMSALDQAMISGVADGGSPDIRDVAQKESEFARRVLLYEGQLQMRVGALSHSADEVEKSIAQLGGHTEQRQEQQRQGRTVLRLRVPAARFFEALEKLSALGEVTSRSITARDVTDRYNDLSSRLETAKALRSRLESLLGRVSDSEERVKILREIARLTETIDSTEATLRDLRGRADYSTLTVTLQLREEQVLTGLHASPAIWLRRLDPAQRTLDGRPLEIGTLPAGFFSQHDAYRRGEKSEQLLSPDGVAIRSARIRRDPAGDLNYWQSLIVTEFERRGWQSRGSRTTAAGSGEWWRTEWSYRRGSGEAVYHLALRIVGDSLEIIEVWYPRPELASRHAQAIEELFSEEAAK